MAKMTVATMSKPDRPAMAVRLSWVEPIASLRAPRRWSIQCQMLAMTTGESITG